jgi:pyruvate formate lyase activating enzyme
MMLTDDIIERAVRLKPFFDFSGGGVTLTGGEVTMQTDFAEAILAGCRRAGIHTAIETSGACAWRVLRRLARAADLVLYDMKLLDPDAHVKWTGMSNRSIVQNAERLAGMPVEIRIPLIPGITDTRANLSAIFDWAREAGHSRVSLLPYNPSASAKYEWLDLPYDLEGAPQSADHLDELLALARAAGLEPGVV